MLMLDQIFMLLNLYLVTINNNQDLNKIRAISNDSTLNYEFLLGLKITDYTI